MSIINCFERVRDFMKSMGKQIPVEDLRAMAVKLEEMRADALSPDQFEKAAAALYADRIAREAAQERAAKVINLQKAETARAVVSQRVHGMDVADKVRSWLLGNSRRIGDSLNLNVYDMAAGMQTKWLRMIRGALRDAGDPSTAESGLLTREVTQEMAAIESGTKQSVSGNSQAYRIAKVYNAVLADVFDVKQAHDPFLGRIHLS